MNSSLGALRDPFELPDMDKAVERIRRALVTGEPITVFGDYDAAKTNRAALEELLAVVARHDHQRALGEPQAREVVEDHPGATNQV